jgi:hypothetical protein
VSPHSLDFGEVKAGKKSAPQTVTLTNSGGTLTISGIKFGGQNPGSFRQTNTCGNSVAPISSCTISVVFLPQGDGGQSATLKIEDSDPTSPQIIGLAGTGIH